MRNIWQALTLLLAISLVILTIKIKLSASNMNIIEETFVTESINSEQAVIDAIMTRSSVRSYTDKKVEQSKIETMLKAGMAAPTAANRQPWRLVVLTDRDKLDAIPAFIPGAHMAAKAQLAIVVCGSPSESLVPEYWVQDCSAVTENILLAAHAMGLGAVWCGAYPNNEMDKVGKMQALLSMPKGIYALSVIVIGYPNSAPIIKDKWDTSKVFYNKF